MDEWAKRRKEHDKWVLRECKRMKQDSTRMRGETPIPASHIPGLSCIVCGKILTGWDDCVPVMEGPDHGVAFAGRPGYGSRFDSIMEPESMMLVVVVCDDCLKKHKDKVLYRETVSKEAHIVSKFLP